MSCSINYDCAGGQRESTLGVFLSPVLCVAIFTSDLNTKIFIKKINNWPHTMLETHLKKCYENREGKRQNLLHEKGKTKLIMASSPCIYISLSISLFGTFNDKIWYFVRFFRIGDSCNNIITTIACHFLIAFLCKLLQINKSIDNRLQNIKAHDIPPQ